jgi:uncharacterized RDD family membrane protein YckC
MKKAGFFQRLIAVVIDSLVLGVGFLFVHVFVAGLWIIYETILISQWNGYTVGKKVMGIRVVTASGGKVDWVKALVRALSKILSSVALGLGYLWMLWDPQNETWEDKISDTKVIEA